MAVLYQAETHQSNRLAEDQIKEMSKMYLDIISEIVEQGQQEGSIRKDLYVSLVKRFIIGSVDEVINTWLHSDGKYDLVSMADPLVELFIRGIGSNEKNLNTWPWQAESKDENINGIDVLAIEGKMLDSGYSLLDKKIGYK